MTITGTGSLSLPSATVAVATYNSSIGYTYINVPINGTGPLEAQSSGSLILNSANTFTGGFKIDGSGGVSFGNNAAFGTGTITWLANGFIEPAGTSAYTITNPMTHLLNGFETFSGNTAGVTFSNWTLPSSGTMTIENIAGTITVAGAISGASELIITNRSGAVWIFSGTNTYSGATVITNNSNLTIGGAGQLGSGTYAANITNNGTFIYASSASQTLSGVISGTGPLNQNGSGTLTLSGANTYSGGTTVYTNTALSVNTIADSGTSAIGNSGTLTLGTGTAGVPMFTYTGSTAAATARSVVLNGSTGTLTPIAMSNGGSLTLSGVVSGNGTPEVITGTLILTGNNTYAGQTHVDSGGTLEIGGAGELGSGSYGHNCVVNGTFIYDTTTAQANTGAFSGSGAFVQEGTGTISLNAASTFTGSVTIGSGSTVIVTGQNFPSGSYAGSMTDNGTFNYNGTNETISGVISGTGALTQSGSSTLTLSGANTYSGGTTISAGTLYGSAAGSLGTGNVTVSGTGILELGSSTAMSSSAILILPAVPTGAVNINFSSGNQNISALIIGSTPQPPGIYSVSLNNSSGAFTGTGNGTITLTSSPYYWDPAENCTDTGGLGTWDASTTADWCNGSSDNTWTSGTGNNLAYFAGSAGGIVTLNGGVTADGLVFTTSGYNISAGSSSPLLTLAGPTINVPTGGTATTIGCKIAGVAGLTESGSGSLTLSGANTYTGITTINNGSIISVGSDGAAAGNAGNLGVVPSSVIANLLTLNGGTLNANATFTMNANRGITMTANSTIDVSSGQTLTYGGIFAGAYSVTKIDSGTLVFSGNHSTYTGPTIITGGILSTGGDNTSGAANLGEVPSSFIANNIVLGGGTLSANNSFALSANRGSQLTANSGLDVGTQVAGAGQNLTVNGAISQSGGSFGITKTSGGILKLHATNTYSGSTIISAGVLALTGTGAISNSASISIAGTATFDVSGLTSTTYTLSSSTTLSASGAGTTTNLGGAVINGASSGTVNLGTQPITLTYNGSAPALYISQGTLSLSGNAFTVNGSALAAGTYTIIQQASGNITSNAGTYTVTGTAIGSGTTGSITVSGAKVNLVVKENPSFSNLTASQSICYGTPSITLGGTVSAAGPLYPASGETITVTINGNLQTTTISGTNGGFSFSYNPSTIPASGTAYTITYSYAGDGSLNPATDTSTALTVNPLPTVSVNSAVECAGGSATLTATTGASNPSYLWSPGGATTASITVSPASTTVYTVTVTDGTTGCANSGSGTVTVDSAVTANAGANEQICSGCAVAIGGSPTAGGGTGPYTYNWSPATGLSSAIVPNPSASPAATTTYTVTVTDSLGCSAHASMTVSLNVAPLISAQPTNTTVCSGSTATFSVTASGSSLNYYWDDDTNGGWGSSNGWTVTGTGGTFLDTSTDNDAGDPSCTSFSSNLGDIDSPVHGQALGMYSGGSPGTVAIRTFPPLAAGQTVSIDFDNSYVDNGSQVGFSLQTAAGVDVLQFYFVGGAADYTYSDDVTGAQNTGIGWTNTGNRVQFALTCSNTYVLTVTTCAGSPITFTGTYSGVTIAQVKLFNGNNDGGNNYNVFFNNFIVGGYTDNADNYYGSSGWANLNFGNQPIAVGNGGSSYTTPALSVANSGSQYQVVVAGCSGALLSSVASVTVNPLPTVSVNSQAICAGGSAILTATTSASTPSYLWSDSETTASITVSPASTTVYTVTVTDGTTGCANSGSGTVTVNPLPTVSVNSAVECAGSPATLTATTSASNPSYLWSDSETTASITVSPASTTVYTVTVTDGTTGCTNGGSGTVTVNPLPTVSVNSAVECAGGSATLTATTSASSPSYLWSDSETTASITVSPASTTIYTVVVTDGTTGCTNSGLGTVTVNPLPSVSVNSATNCAVGSATLTASTSASSPSYLWSDSETTASITVSPASTTIYTVVVTDGTTGCTNSGSGTVTVNPLPSVSVNSATICSGASTNLTATTSASNPSYLWSPGGATNSSITVSPVSTTTYTVTVTDGTMGCTNSGSGTVTVGFACTCDTAPSNMVLWLPFDETSGSASANLAAPAYYGTQVGGPSVVLGAYVDNSLQFSGSQYVDVPDYSAIDIGTNDFTIDAWVNLSTKALAAPPSVIVDKTDTNTGIGYNLAVTNSALVLTMGASYTDTGALLVPPDGLWHFVGVSVSQCTSNVSFYIDGNFNSMVALTPVDVSNTHDLWVAAADYGDNVLNQPWQGDLDEVEVYNRALASNELYGIYDAGPLGKCKPACTTNITANCASNKTEYGSGWTFDLPAGSSCCGSGVTVTSTGIVTNGTIPQLITQTWLLTDACGNSNTCSQTVTVYPQLTIACSSNISVTAAGPGGSVVFFNVTATGGCSPPPFVTANPPSGSTFPIGTTTVNCTASDTCGNTNNCSFTVTVNPQLTITCPSNITVMATGTNGANVFYTATASGGCGGLNIVGNPPSGSLFPIGTTTVTNTVTDSCSNQTSCSFTVTVYPQLLIACSSNLTVTATGPGGAVVFFTVTATGGCSPPPFVTANPPSGSTFPIGTTTVISTASDTCGNTNNCSFTVTVNPQVAVVLTGTRPYDGTNDASASILTISNNADGTNLTLSGSATLAGSAVGSQNISSFAGLTLGGSAAYKYTLTGASGSVSITNPFNPFSIVCSFLDNTGTNIVVCWASLPGVTYTVLTNTSLNPPQTWAAAGTTTATGTNTCFTLPGGIMGNTNVNVVIKQ